MAQKPHIVHVFDSFGPGGAQVRTAVVMNGLKDEFRHTIVHMGKDERCKDKVDPGVDIEFVTLPRDPGLRQAWGLGGQLRALKGDVVLGYNWASLIPMIGCVLRRVRPWCQVMDGMAEDEATGQLARRLFFRRRVYRRASAVLVVSRVLERLALESWGIRRERTLYMPNGIDTDRFTPGPASDVRARLGLNDDHLIVGTVAHLRAEKNPALLLRGFAAIAEEFPQAHLVYVGGTPKDQSAGHDQAWTDLQNGLDHFQLRDRVHFTDLVRDTAPYYRAFDVFCLSSHTEQMPLSVAEAMAAGKSVVSTDVGDVKDMVCDEARRFVVPIAGETLYAASLRTLLVDVDLRTRIGATHRDRAVDRFDHQTMIDRWRTFLLDQARC